MERSKTPGLALALAFCVFVWSGSAYFANAQPAPTPDKESAEIKEKKSRFSDVLRNATNLCDENEARNFFCGLYDNENLDIVARALERIRVNTASILPPPKPELLDRFALEALLLDDTLGALNEADAYAKMISGQSSYHGIECFASVIKELDATGRKREAALVQERFLEAFKQVRPSFLAQTGEPEEKVLQSIRETTALTRHCLDAIASGAKAVANSDAEKLLSLYQSEVPHEERIPPCTIIRQNLFCTVLNVARKLSNHGWYSESNALLDKLKAAATAQKDWAPAIDFILMEQIINGERAKGKTGDLWTKLDEEPLFSFQTQYPAKIVTHDFSTSEKLRLLAITFYTAGELSRSDTFITRALKTYSDVDFAASPDHQIEHSKEEGVAGDGVMLMLSAACVKAAEHKFDEANSFIEKALQGPPVATPAYGGRLADLARIYEENNRNTEAIAFLKRARDKNIPVAFRMARHSTSSPYLVDFWLAKLLFEAGKSAEARPVIEDAIKQAVHPNQPPNSGEEIPGIREDDYDYIPFILAGDCAAAQKDYRAAAVRYEQAGMSDRVGSLPVSEKPLLDELWLQKAVELANKAADFPKSDKARFYMELATKASSVSPQRAFDFDKTASDLLPDSDPKKPSLLAEMARLSQQISGQQSNNRTTGASTTSSATASATLAQTSPHENITLLREAASVAEKAGEKAVYARYFTLANAEAAYPELLDQAIKDCKRAIQLYTGIPAPAWRGYGRTAPLNPTIVASSLSRNARTADGINLMEEAATKVESSNGPSSRETQEQLSVLMNFYIARKDDENALRSLDRVLACKMKPTATNMFWSDHGDHGFSISRAYEWAKSIAAENPQASTTVLSKVLAAQQKQLPADDQQIANTYLAFASVHIVMKDDRAALSDYQHAFNINKLYSGEAVEVKRIPPEYFELLRKAGKSTEADRLEALKKNPWPTAAELQQKREQAARLRDADLSTVKAEYEKAKGEAPYSTDTQLLLRRLGSVAKAEKDWDLAAACDVRQLEIDDHFGEPTTKIVNDHEALIDLYIQAEKVDDAKNWLQKLADTAGVNANEVSRYQQKVLTEYIRVRRFDDARKHLQELWRHAHSDALGLCRCERDLIEALKNCGKDAEEHAETARLFELHSRWILNITSTDDAIVLAKLGIDAGLRKWIPELLTQGETLATGTARFYYLPKLAELRRNLGDEKHANELTEKCKDLLSGPRSSLRDLDSRKVSTVQTKAGLEFPLPPPPTSYSFNLAALSSNSLIFDNHARVSVEQAAQLSFAGTYGVLKTAQGANHAGDLSFVCGSSQGLPIVPAPSRASPVIPGRPTRLPEVLQLPFKPALEAPLGFHNFLPPFPVEFLQIKLGGSCDYQVSSLAPESLQVMGGGRVRLLISGDLTGTRPVFHLRPKGLVNAESPNGPPKKDSTIEIWYGGTATIKLDEDSTFNGIIYAPNARIEIGPGDATFYGAMIARDIVVTGDARIYWDPSLANWKEDLDLH
jgi:tetratricopeptide (TPR) repeat protein